MTTTPEQSKPLPRLLTAAEAAEHLRFTSTVAFRAALPNLGIPYVRIRNRLLLPEPGISEWLRANTDNGRTAA